MVRAHRGAWCDGAPPRLPRPRPASFRTENRVDGEITRVLVEHIAVDVGRLGPRAGHLSLEKPWGVDDAMVRVLGLR